MARGLLKIRGSSNSKGKNEARAKGFISRRGVVSAPINHERRGHHPRRRFKKKAGVRGNSKSNTKNKTEHSRRASPAVLLNKVTLGGVQCLIQS